MANKSAKPDKGVQKIPQHSCTHNSWVWFILIMNERAYYVPYLWMIGIHWHLQGPKINTRQVRGKIAVGEYMKRYNSWPVIFYEF